ncbi:LysR family transcriptional regulator [Marinomonas pollencensis]|uniref:LysR family glycine cleavage system transcriptional activator n=1 Tax=Marinomonas pollencensis TaxID=491954 RepID=A0A3E0DXG5_9GAMM|nr:LysR family transcriptional regulator [Marinomonas pollencensis]REG86791.1 LysR family glycine cleavage system transcriptional activator [Marinomonas pollencensis]
MKRPPPNNWLFVFKVIVESGSITEAAERLYVSQSAVSQQIKSLEDYLGRRLIIRGKKGIILTDEGKHYYNIVKVAMDKIALATDQLFGTTHKETVTVKSNYSFADVWISRALSEFHNKYPDICVEIYTGFWLTDLGDLDGSIEIRYGDGIWPDSNSHQLSNDYIFPVCSPRTKEKIQSLEDVIQHPFVSVMGNKNGWGEWLSEYFPKAEEKQSVLSVESNVLAYNACISGDYVALGISSLVNHFINSGELEKLDYGEIKCRENYYIIEPNDHVLSKNETIFLNWIKDRFEI